jgi:hypothetical protein
MQDMVQAIVLPRAFHCQKIQWFLHHTQNGTIPLTIAANWARACLSDVEAHRTGNDHLL